ncbi:hypothetical protein EYF80_046179 [Liparis tanakae]|uniref:Uncharacterized protein n=1 Tax=Liparis tanakae TaxID=230148 RepID=A0A4Z2FRU8_9TELE|nr:hypothetical protein EYF80_046179 [Liparis tanakae]
MVVMEVWTLRSARVHKSSSNPDVRQASDGGGESGSDCGLISPIIISDARHSRRQRNDGGSHCTNKRHAIMNALPPGRQAINAQRLVAQPCRIPSPPRVRTHSR